MIAIMGNEYSKSYTSYSESEIFEKRGFYTSQFQEKFAQK